MKYFLSLIVSFTILCTSLSAVEYGQLKVSALPGQQNEATLELYEGDLCELLLIDGYDAYVRYTTEIDEETVEYTIAQRSSGTFSQNLSRKIVGPLTLKLETWGINTSNGHDPNYRRHATLHYKLTRASEVEYKNVNIVALPASTVGQGTHEIVVEASDDLQTWTPVHSSYIGGSKAFFRTRVVEAGD